MAVVADAAIARLLPPAFARTHRATAGTVRSALLATDPAGYAGAGAAIRDVAFLDRLGGIAARPLMAPPRKPNRPHRDSRT